MYNIVLLCQHGASTDILAVKMREAATALKIEAIVNAYSFTKIEQFIDEADIILLGPQVRFKKRSFDEQYGDKGIEFKVINIQDYGMLNGEKVLLEAIESIQSKN